MGVGALLSASCGWRLVLLFSGALKGDKWHLPPSLWLPHYVPRGFWCPPDLHVRGLGVKSAHWPCPLAAELQVFVVLAVRSVG